MSFRINLLDERAGGRKRLSLPTTSKYSPGERRKFSSFLLAQVNSPGLRLLLSCPIATYSTGPLTYLHVYFLESYTILTFRSSRAVAALGCEQIMFSSVSQMKSEHFTAHSFTHIFLLRNYFERRFFSIIFFSDVF